MPLCAPARMATSARIFRSNSFIASSPEFLRPASSADLALASTASNPRSPERPESPAFHRVQKFPQSVRRNTHRAARVHRFHFKKIRRRYRDLEPRRVFARESLDNCVSRLTAAGIEDLHIVRIGLLTCARAASIKDDCDIHTGPILIMPEFFNQCLACEGRSSRVQPAQFWPSKNDAVTVDNEIARRHSAI